MNWPSWRTSRKRASSSGMSGAYCALTSISGICDTATSHCSPAVEKVRRREHDAYNDRVLGVLEAVVEAVVARAERVSDAGDGERPDGGADQRQDGVGPERHLERTGRDRDERAYDRREATEEDADVPPAVEPALRAVEALR